MPRGCPDGMIPQMENISYDARGNITSRSPRHGSGGTITLTYTGDRLATRKVGTGTAVSFAHDSFARMTTDAEAGLSITYNALDLPETVSMGNTLKAKYTYLSDGTKVSALDASGAGLVYRGPFTYRRGSGGTLAFESAPFDRGRLTEDGVRYHVTDHLGSVRAGVNDRMPASMLNRDIGFRSGWGYYVEIVSGWYAGFDYGKRPTIDSRILFFFKYDFDGHIVDYDKLYKEEKDKIEDLRSIATP